MTVNATVAKIICSRYHLELYVLEAVMQAHVSGKKHKMRAGLVERQLRQASCSVYVVGFPRGMAAQQLSHYFSQYGPLDRVYVDRDRVRLFSDGVFIYRSSGCCGNVRDTELSGLGFTSCTAPYYVAKM